MLDRWKRAVIHLECATDSEDFYGRIKRIERQRDLLDQGKITHEQFAEHVAGRSRDIRLHGTALFLSHSGRRYLLTARHVVWDERSAKRALEGEERRSLAWPEDMRQHIIQSAGERAQNNIFPIIFRVPSIDEVLAKKECGEFLMNLGAGASFTVPYTFSTPELDLALISLDQRDTCFAEDLISHGFVPVSLDDVADAPDSEGQEVFTLGFPSSTALLGQVSLHPASARWSSSYYSLPVSSFGRVSMLHHALPFFWAGVSISPGNSGGPVVTNDRLVGVVSAQATLAIDGVPDVYTRIPFARIIKAKFVRELLEIQVEKDQR